MRTVREELEQLRADRDRYRRLAASRQVAWKRARERVTGLLNANHKLNDRIRRLKRKVREAVQE